MPTLSLSKKKDKKKAPHSGEMYQYRRKGFEPESSATADLLIYLIKRMHVKLNIYEVHLSDIL